MWKMSRLWGIAMMSWVVIYKRYFQRFWQFLPITRLSITPTTPVDESADEDVSLLCAPQPPDELLLEVLSWRTNEDGNDDDEDENNEDGNDDADDYEGGNVDEPIDMIIIDKEGWAIWTQKLESGIKGCLTNFWRLESQRWWWLKGEIKIVLLL